MNPPWRSAEREIGGEIMSTDIYLKVASDNRTPDEIQDDLDTAIGMFCDFASRFSRFDPRSELSRFNASEKAEISETLFDLLTHCKTYFQETGGIFHPGILPALVAAGYDASFYNHKNPSLSVHPPPERLLSFDELVLDASTRTAHKPLALKIDLGGIGKGYIIDRVAEWLSARYPHSLVDAGGDIRVWGGDITRGWDYWTIDIEHPQTGTPIPETLLILENGAVATSGGFRRQWNVGGYQRHHLIDPRTKTSATTNLASVTVIQETTEAAEVFAKTICILGASEGLSFAHQKHIPVVLVTTSGEIVYNEHVKPYLRPR